MTKFHEGQEVEVEWLGGSDRPFWRKASITNFIVRGPTGSSYQVEFRDGTRGVFDVDHIRATPQQQAQEYYDNPSAKQL